MRQKSRISEEEAAFEVSKVQETTATHLILAVAVALLSVGITLCGMAIIVEQKSLRHAGLVVGAIGSIGVAYGLFTFVF